jgi:hypothetical protein
MIELYLILLILFSWYNFYIFNLIELIFELNDKIYYLIVFIFDK